MPEAGISLALADGWERISPKNEGVLLAASPGGERESPVGILVHDAADLLEATAVPRDPEALEAAAIDLRDGPVSLGASTADLRADAVEVPAGPTIRLRYSLTVVFYGERAVIDYWIVTPERVLVLVFVSGFGPTPDPQDERAVEDMVRSIRLLPSDGSAREITHQSGPAGA